MVVNGPLARTLGTDNLVYSRGPSSSKVNGLFQNLLLDCLALNLIEGILWLSVQSVLWNSQALLTQSCLLQGNLSLILIPLSLINDKLSQQSLIK